MDAATPFGYPADAIGSDPVLNARAHALAEWVKAQPYEAGWHWIVETHSHADYMGLLVECERSPRRAKAALREQVRLLVEREREVAFE